MYSPTCRSLFGSFTNYLYIYLLDYTTADNCFKYALGYLSKPNSIITKIFLISKADFFQLLLYYFILTTNYSVFHHSIPMM